MPSLNRETARLTRGDRQELRVVRASSDDLERLFADMPRTSERTKAWLRDHFVQGRSVAEIASAYGVPVQLVGNKVRPVGARLAERASPHSFVRVTLSLPVSLGLEVRALAHALDERGSRTAIETLEPVLKAMAAARQKLDRSS